MQRSEGVQVFREICQCIPDALISSISIAPRSTEEFELRISMFLDKQSLQHIQAIVDSHGLILREDKGTLLIYRDDIEAAGIELIAKVTL